MNKLCLLFLIFYTSSPQASEQKIGWEALPPYFKASNVDYVEEMIMPFVYQTESTRPSASYAPTPDNTDETMQIEIAETIETSDEPPIAHPSNTKTIVYTSTDGTKHQLDIPKDSSSRKLTAGIIDYFKKYPPRNEDYPSFPAHCIEPDCPLPKKEHGTCKNALSLNAHLGTFCSKNKKNTYYCPKCAARRRYISALWAHYVETHL